MASDEITQLIQYLSVLDNLMNDVETMGIDFRTDTYDGGQHLNYVGSVKMSDFFAEILDRDYGVPCHWDDSGLTAVYNEKLAKYDEAILKGKEN